LVQENGYAKLNSSRSAGRNIRDTTSRIQVGGERGHSTFSPLCVVGREGSGPTTPSKALWPQTSPDVPRPHTSRGQPIRAGRAGQGNWPRPSTAFAQDPSMPRPFHLARGNWRPLTGRPVHRRTGAVACPEGTTTFSSMINTRGWACGPAHGTICLLVFAHARPPFDVAQGKPSSAFHGPHGPLTFCFCPTLARA